MLILVFANSVSVGNISSLTIFALLTSLFSIIFNVHSLVVNIIQVGFNNSFYLGHRLYYPLEIIEEDIKLATGKDVKLYERTNDELKE